MKVLVVSPGVPWPLDQGLRVRTFNLMRELSGRHDIDFVCGIERSQTQSETEEARRELAKICRSLNLVQQPNRGIFSRGALKLAYYLAYYAWGVYSPEFYYNLWPLVHAVRRQLACNAYDAILTTYWYTAIKPIQEARVPTICDTIDVVWEYASRRWGRGDGSPFRQLAVRRQLSRLHHREAAVLNSHDLLICVHEKDARTLRETMGVKTPSVAMAHIRDTGRIPYVSNRAADSVILFFGALHNPTNIEAARYAATTILPAVRRRQPDARLIIAGSGAGPEVETLGNIDGVSILGYVPDVANLLHQAKVLLLPLRMGSGIKGRVLESMEAGTPIVGSSIAAEGIPVTSGETMIVTDDLEEMAVWTARLLADETLRQRISQNARRFVEETYSWESTYGQIHKCLAMAQENYANSTSTERQ